MDIRNAFGMPLALALLTLAGAGLAFAQDPFGQQMEEGQTVTLPATSNLTTSADVIRLNQPRWATVTRRSESEIQKALTKIKSAEGSNARGEAEDELLTALSTEYDKQMDKYDKHIESLEQELEDMRERLSRRRKAKEEVVELKLKQLVAEVDGLGWPGDSRKTRFGFPSNDNNIFGSSNFRRSNTPYLIQGPAKVGPSAVVEEIASPERPARPVRTTNSR